jgi:hypothetical protein
MTEAQWLACADPQTLLGHLGQVPDQRRLLLFGVACCRRVAHLATPQMQSLLERVEQFAEGLIPGALVAGDLAYPSSGMDGAEAGANQAIFGLVPGPRALVPAVGPIRSAELAAIAAGMAFAYAAGTEQAWKEPRRAVVAKERRDQAEIVRDLFGNPFHPVRFVDPMWHRWRDGLILSMVRSIAEECRYADLPILADALEEAGCTNGALLDHCRSSGPHVRGCWAVDLLLGKQ